MRKFLFLLVLPVFLTACGAGGSDGPSRDEVFVQVVRDEISFPDSDDDRLVNMAHDICDAIDDGATMRQFAAVAVETGIDPGDFGYFIGASVAAYCPENDYIL